MSDTHTERFFAEMQQSIEEGTFLKLSLSKYRGNDDSLKNIYVTPAELRGAEKLSFLYRYERRDETKNFSFPEGMELLRGLAGTDFLSLHLFSTAKELSLEFSKKRKSSLIEKKVWAGAEPVQRTLSHDHRKKRLIEPSTPYLHSLGISDESGRIRDKMQDKWRQINKFLEIVESHFESSQLAEHSVLSVVDMGSGKGYLTFAVYDYFTRRGIQASVLGIEARQGLVDFCNGVARESGFDGLEFRKGSIGETALGETDMLIALHACNTATDDAIYAGIRAGAEIIICSPCCHQELRPQMKGRNLLSPILKNGILMEREAEMLTDGIRSLLMEREGYDTKVFEFISTEHTAKNLMITGIKKHRPADAEKYEKQIVGIKEFFGITSQHLEQLLEKNS